MSTSKSYSSTTPHPYPATWLALGDSYTIGEGVKPDERWPTLLTQRYSSLSSVYLAETGWTTRNLLAAIATAQFAAQYDRVSVQIGVNDQYDGVGTARYREGLTDILDFALNKVADPQRVLVLSIPDYSVTPFAQARALTRAAEEVSLFNTICQEIALAKHTTYCDITPLSRRAATDLTLLVEDGLHPSGKMYQLWVEKLVQENSF